MSGSYPQDESPESVTVSSYNNYMDFSTLGPWIAAAAAASALVRAFIAWMALRGTKPKDRPEILRSLPGWVPSSRRDPPAPVPVSCDDRAER